MNLALKHLEEKTKGGADGIILFMDMRDASIMKNFSICLVSPSRWNTKLPQGHFIDKFTDKNLTIEAIMVSQNESHDF
mgnify:CR=1 FL=1